MQCFIKEEKFNNNSKLNSIFTIPSIFCYCMLFSINFLNAIILRNILPIYEESATEFFGATVLGRNKKKCK